MKTKFDVQVLRGHYYFEVLINGLPHIEIDRKQYIGFQSWNDSDSMFVIEYYTKVGKIKTEFDSMEKWIKVLTELKKKN